MLIYEIEDMIGIDFSNSTVKDFGKIKRELDLIKGKELPEFAKYKPNLSEIEKAAKKYMKYKNVIVIGNGGSITTIKGYYNALARAGKKKAYFVDSGEPDKLNEIAKLAGKKDSIVLPISKSGTNTQMFESFLYFFNKGYKILGVKSKDKGALYEMFDRRKVEFIEHPIIGGRYTGMTPVAMLPAYLLGMDVKKISSGAFDMYKRCDPSTDIEKNPALKISAVCYMLDKEGYEEIFMPMYSYRLFGFNTLIMQLIHESSAKEGKGQTMIGVEAPECQHHTNQRFLGGKRNMLGLFTIVKKQDDEKIRIKVEKGLKNISYREGKLGDLDGNSYADTHRFEYLGTMEDASNRKIPNMTIEVDRVDAYNVGEFVALWQYIAVYSSWLRNVDPFNQPDVEDSKEISFRERMELKRK